MRPGDRVRVLVERLARPHIKGRVGEVRRLQEGYVQVRLDRTSGERAAKIETLPRDGVELIEGGVS